MPPSLPLQTALKIFYSKQTLPRKDWEQYFSQRQQTGNTTWSPMTARPSLPMKKTIILPQLEFLALKWAILQHFKEYLLYWPLQVRTDNIRVASLRPLYAPLWLLLPWISCVLISQALRPHWSQTNHLELPTSWFSKTTSRNTCWHM